MSDPVYVQQPHLLQDISDFKYIRYQDCLVRTGTLCYRKMVGFGNRWHVQQEDRDRAGLAAVDDEAVQRLR